MAASDSSLELLDEVCIYSQLPEWRHSEFHTVKGLRRERRDLPFPMAILNGEIDQEGYTGALSHFCLKS